VRSDDVLEDADDVGLELFDVRAVEYRSADADHARPYVADAHVRGGPVQERGRAENCRTQDEDEPAQCHGFNSVIREKCLRVKEKRPIG
jgi:hypothetical protein